MLEAHLDPKIDAASRRPETIERSVDWIAESVGLCSGQRVIDLGCGPGLYCERFARFALSVAGADFSPRSLDYARRSAKTKRLTIDYILLNYTAPMSEEWAGGFDLATLIYWDFCVLGDSERDRLLENVARIVRPGGHFIFDVTTRSAPNVPDGAMRMVFSPAGGFWKAGPYIEFEWRYWYPEATTELRQVAILEPGDQISLYRVWERHYDTESLVDLLARFGFAIEKTAEDLTGKPLTSDSKGLAVIAKRL